MFSGKKERAFAEEMRAIKEQNEQNKELFFKISGQKDNVQEQFAQMTASRAQQIQDIAQMEERLHEAAGLARNSGAAADEVHSTLMEAGSGIESFDANHSAFLEQVKQQNDRIMEIVDNNKHFTTPMKYISEWSTPMKEESRGMHERAGRMIDFSKNMSVLSLNAAIEAGRMGTAGEKFIASAEEIRSFSESYEKEARALDEQLKESDARIGELEEQVHHLNQLLKENNISMTKLLKDSMQSMASYEDGQLALRDMLPETIVGRADALQQSQKEEVLFQERLLQQLGDIRNECEEQKHCADELETIYKELQQSVASSLAD